MNIIFINEKYTYLCRNAKYSAQQMISTCLKFFIIIVMNTVGFVIFFVVVIIMIGSLSSIPFYFLFAIVNGRKENNDVSCAYTDYIKKKC